MSEAFKSVVDVVAEVAARYPDSPAVIEDGKTVLTYRMLWDRALRVASFVAVNNKDKDFVAIALSKSARFVVSVFGCWMAGKAFVPVGFDLPEARRKIILEEAGIDCVIDRGVYGQCMESAPLPRPLTICETTRAYVIYSSGTTGKPKGIVVSHAGLANLASAQSEMFHISRMTRTLWLLSTNFDASVSDILVTLTSGGALVIETGSALDVAAMLYDIIDSRGVTYVDIPPSLLRLQNPANVPRSLETVVIGGEVADAATVRRWAGKVRLVCVYGPTEATVCSSMCRCPPTWDRPLIGDVLPGVSYLIYDGKSYDAREGELWISGIGLAECYLDNTELTDRKFPVVNGTRYYRTSDYVRRLEDGRMEFVRRIDRQVKFHGQLIELEEIERVILSLRFVARCGVVKRRVSASNDKEIIAAFVELAETPRSRNEVMTDIQRTLRHNLPVWMIPGSVTILSAIPSTASGKIDYSRLVTVAIPNTVVCAPATYSSVKTEKIAHIMGDVLKMRNYSECDDFLACGADSLDCLTLIARLGAIGISVSPAELRQSSTPLALAQCGETGTAMCVKSSDLRLDWEYEPRVTVGNNGKSGEGILITGATGFLGAHLLAELTKRPEYREKAFFCLVRCDNAEHGMGRIRQSLRRYGLNVINPGRIVVVPGDLSEKNFGLDTDLYNNLSEIIGIVYHCAAKVNMLASYNQLYGANVAATRNMIDFCCAGCAKTLNYASTLSVFVATSRDSGVALESDRLLEECEIYGGYGQTKFVAEKMLLSCADKFGGLNIFRFGLLCGSTRTGIGSPGDFFGMFVKGAVRSGSLPIDRTRQLALDISPVDLAVGMMADISVKSPEGIYHIAADYPLYYQDLARMLSRRYAIRLVGDFKEWYDGLDRRDPVVNALALSLCRLDPVMFKANRYMDLFQTTGIVFDMSESRKYTAIRCEWNETLIISYFKELLS